MYKCLSDARPRFISMNVYIRGLVVLFYKDESSGVRNILAVIPLTSLKEQFDSVLELMLPCISVQKIIELSYCFTLLVE